MAENKKWICVAIGCVECSEKSWFVGFFDTKEEAQSASHALEERGEEFHHALIEEVKLPENGKST
jgi:hypothetical protein